jgi:hypothetical protein
MQERSRGLGLEARANASDAQISRMMACLTQGKTLNVQGACVNTFVDYRICVCPTLPRMSDCAGLPGQSAPIVCTAGYAVAESSVPYCMGNGSWSSAFPACTSIPVWSNSSMTISFYDTDRGAKTLTFVATNPDGGVITYTLESGSLPVGMALSSSGIISGLPLGVLVSANFTFTIRAINSADVYASRFFAITLLAPVKVGFAYTGADQVWTVPTGLTRFSAKLWGAGGGCQEQDGSNNGGGAGGFTSGLFSTGSFSAFAIMVGAGGFSGYNLGNGGGATVRAAGWRASSTAWVPF